MARINPETLEIMSRIDITDYLSTASTTFAHPHVISPNEWITMGMNTKTPKWHYEFIKYESSGGGNDSLVCQKPQILASIPSSHALGLSYFHSFGLTENYIVFLEQSLVFDMCRMISVILFNKAFSDALLMKTNFETRIHLINRKTGEIHKQKFITDPIFVFHHINAYETKEDLTKGEPSRIVVDFCGFDVDKFDINKLTYADLFTERHFSQKMISTARRIVIPISAPFSLQPIRCELRQLNSLITFELPTINYGRFNGKEYKYFYGLNVFQKPFSIVKVSIHIEVVLQVLNICLI